jgi:hypothetical protein
MIKLRHIISKDNINEYKILKKYYERKDFKTTRIGNEEKIELEIIRDLYDTNPIARSIIDDSSNYLKNLDNMDTLTEGYDDFINRMQNILAQYIEVTNE